MTEIKLKIDGQEVVVPDGATILEAAKTAGIDIPHLCYREDLPASSACRLCVVGVEGARTLTASCSTQATNNMTIETDNERTARARKLVVELLLSNHDSECPHDGPDSACELGKWARELNVSGDRFEGERRTYETDDSTPFFVLDHSRCILCERCVTACNEVQHIGAISFAHRGFDTKVATPFDLPLLESACTSCGQCLSVCPTGAIRLKSPVEQPARVVDTTCPYCGVGCGIKAKVDSENRIIEVLEDPENQSSLGRLCVKGRFGFGFVNHEDRLTEPLIRLDGELTPASWDEALDYVADRLAGYDGDSFGTLCSAKATNEDGYVQQKLARLLMKSNHIDHCARLCHSSSVVAMMASLGSGATSNSYADYEDAGCLMVVGSDPSSNHPVIGARIRKAIVERGAKLIVINPRRTEMCDLAEVWLRPRPGTDVALLNAVAKAVLDEGLADKRFIADRTEGFDEWRSVIDKYTPEYAESITGVPTADIVRAARLFASPPFSGSCLIWGMGVTQHTNGTANAHGLVNLALVSGQLGSPGSGISPLRGQNNVQGCSDIGGLPNFLPGYQVIGEDTVPAFERAWGGSLPSKPGMAVTDMIEAMHDGRMQAAYVVGENPLLSEPDLNHADEAFRKLDFLVVQDLFLHETAMLADVVLPAASFAEKEGTFTNSERRLQRVRQVVPPVGQSRPDWDILSDLGRRLSARLGLGLEKEFSYENASEIFDEMAGVMPIVAGLSYDRLDNEGGIQWPCPDADHPGTRYLYESDFPRGQRAKFVAFDQGPPAEEMPSERFPLILNTGRILYHWHGGTLTRRAPTLLERVPELEIAIHADDGDKYGITDGEWVRIRSRRGDLEARARYSDNQRPGELFVPFVKLQEHAANFLTNAALDPASRIPEYKVCAVRFEKLG